MVQCEATSLGERATAYRRIGCCGDARHDTRLAALFGVRLAMVGI